MTESDPPVPLPDDIEKLDAPQTDLSAETLREILLGSQSRRVSEVEADVEDLQRRISDDQAIIAMIAPVMGDAIRRKIREAREEMIEALYPIIGQVVARAVSEAVSDLSRRVDAQVKASFDPSAIWWRIRGRLGGASDADMALRASLPFEVAEVFLIHRESGLLLRHLSRETEAASESDLISGMLTAIRDFSQEAFGAGKEGDLDEIEYGDLRILIEAAQHSYLAVVVEGTEPPGFRTEMREQLLDVELEHLDTLRVYKGDPVSLGAVEGQLSALMKGAEPEGLSTTQRRALLGALGLLAILTLCSCLAARWVWLAFRSPPASAPAAVQSTPLPSVEPTSPLPVSPTSSPSPPTAAPSPTPPPQPTPSPAEVGGEETMAAVMIGNVWLREAASADSPRLGVVLEEGQRVEVLAVNGEWYRVRWSPNAEAEAVGWVPARWVETTVPLDAVTSSGDA